MYHVKYRSIAIAAPLHQPWPTIAGLRPGSGLPVAQFPPRCSAAHLTRCRATRPIFETRNYAADSRVATDTANGLSSQRQNVDAQALLLCQKRYVLGLCGRLPTVLRPMTDHLSRERVSTCSTKQRLTRYLRCTRAPPYIVLSALRRARHTDGKMRRNY